MRTLLSLLLLALVAAPAALAQNRTVTAPMASPPARVVQTVGLTELAVDYHRPAVRERTLWGGLVPYDQVWRAGANQNTTFETSTDIRVEGERLPAGRYGLHVIPRENAPWTVIFSTMADAWGSYSYDEAEDALRVDVSPEEGPAEERLSYTFRDPGMDAATLVLRWGTTALPVSIAVDTPAVVLASMERELRGLPRFFWEGWNGIAAYALSTETRMDEALGWIDQSIGTQRNGTNLLTKVGLLTALGRGDEARALEGEIATVASEAEMRGYANWLSAQDRADDALGVLEMNAQRHADNWIAHAALGRALAQAGDSAEAISAYQQARARAPEAQHARIDGWITQARGG